MIYKKQPHKIEGLWCRKDSKFYYLETGTHSIRNPFDRIRSSLRMRDLLPHIDKPERGNEPVIRMTMAEAKKRNYEIVPIYLNNLVKNAVIASQAEESKKPTIWGRRG